MKTSNMTETEVRSLKIHSTKVMNALKPHLQEFLIKEIREPKGESGEVIFEFGKFTQKDYSKTVMDFLNDNKKLFKIEKIEDATLHYAYFLYFKLRDNTIKVPILIDKSTTKADDDGYHKAFSYKVWINTYMGEKLKK